MVPALARYAFKIRNHESHRGHEQRDRTIEAAFKRIQSECVKREI